LADETAGEAIAQKDEKEAVAEDAAAEVDPAVEAEPEDKTKSYDEYLAELAQKKLDLGEQKVRKANEGSSAKFPEGKAVAREEGEDYFAPTGGKKQRTRERKEKAFVELDGDRLLQPAPRENFGGRGGRGRGEGRGGRDGESRGRGGRGGRGRGEGRGGESRGEGRGEGRGGPRGPRGGAQSGPNLNDNKAFPSLGA
jgi:plasminogen activator inhibitor 1 RNA-binding protein